MTFKSKIGNSLIGLIGEHTFALVVIGGLIYFINGFRLADLHWTYLMLLIPYSLGIYIYAGLFNNDIIVGDGKIEIVNHVPLFRKRISYDYSTVKTITLRHDWTETFGQGIKSKGLKYIFKEVAQLFVPYNYKWVKVETDKEYKFYCFGIEYDYYDNEGHYLRSCTDF